PRKPLIMISALFCGITPNANDHTEWLRALGVEPQAGEKFPGVTAILTDASFQVVSRSLPKKVITYLLGEDPNDPRKKDTASLLSAPKVTTKSGQRAVIEIIREKRYATEWKKGTKPGTSKPTAFETRTCGVTLEAEPTVQEDGTIALDLI